jgi:hypothetical protein
VPFKKQLTSALLNKLIDKSNALFVSAVGKITSAGICSVADRSLKIVKSLNGLPNSVFDTSLCCCCREREFFAAPLL